MICLQLQCPTPSTSYYSTTGAVPNPNDYDYSSSVVTSVFCAHVSSSSLYAAQQQTQVQMAPMLNAVLLRENNLTPHCH